jgi:Xaa-Pro dipeptidase
MTMEDARPFAEAEYADRLAKARQNMRVAGLDAVLLFAQESMYYLTGFDSGGYVFFQCMVVTVNDQPITLLTRRPDRDQANATSNIDDVRIWLNAEDADPAADVRDIMVEKGLKAGKIGIELNTYGLTGYNHSMMQAALDGFCTLVDGSDIVRSLRTIKSPAEIDIFRKAASLCDKALLNMIDVARPGIPDSTLAAACMHELMAGGGDVSPAGPLVNSGSRSSYGRGVGGPRMISERDQVLVEFAGTYRRYNACVEATIAIGQPSDKLLHMHGTACEALAAMTAAAKPGRRIGEIDDEHRRVFDAAGYRDNRFEACGYSLGATYRPSWMDVPPMIYSGNPNLLEPGMVLFPHAIIGDQTEGIAAGVGHTILITEDGAEVLNQVPTELHRK